MIANLKSIWGKYCLALLALLSLSVSVYGESDSEASNTIEEIVVTAQKRSENAQTVPVAISTFTKSMAKDTGADTIAAIMPMIPGLTGSVVGVGTNIYAIRGVASNDFTVGSEPSTGVYMDGAYVGRNVLAAASYFDINRIEVVKGPQGTLFGRNSDSGAISLISNKPEQANYLDVELAGGGNGQQEYNIVGNLMASDTLAFRLAYHRKRLDARDIFRIVNQNENAFMTRDDIRLEALWKPSEVFSALVTLSYSDAKDNAIAVYNPSLQLPQPGKEFPDKIAFSASPGHRAAGRENSRPWGADVQLTWDLNDTMTLTSITDARGFDFDFREDVDGTSDDALIDAIFAVGTGGSTLEFNQPNIGQKSWAQELRLVGTSGNVDWFVGTSYFYEDVREITQVNLIDTALGLGLLGQDLTIGNGQTSSAGVYGQATWHVTGKLGLTAGIRWSLDKKDWSTFAKSGLGIITPDTLGGKLHDHETWREATSRLVVNYQFTPQIMAYASFNQGFKGGGFNTGPSDFNGDGIADQVAPFTPETSTAYEAGLKSELLQRRLRLNLSTFFTGFSDLQVQTATLGGILVTNAAKAQSRGVEVEINYLTPIEGLVVAGNYSWLDAEFSSGSLTGNRLFFAPPVTWSTTLKYAIPLFGGSLNLWTLYTWQDNLFHDINNLQRESGYGLWNARIGFQPASDRWEVYVRADNINNQDYAVGRQDIGLGQQIDRGLPRLIKAGFKFHIG